MKKLQNLSALEMYDQLMSLSKQDLVAVADKVGVAVGKKTKQQLVDTIIDRLKAE